MKFFLKEKEFIYTHILHIIYYKKFYSIIDRELLNFFSRNLFSHFLFKL